MTRYDPSFILDISRLLLRAGQAVPTGIDRVELAYAEHLLAHYAERTTFTALSLTGRMGLLPHNMVRPFVASLSRKWNSGTHTKKPAYLSYILRTYLLSAARNVPQQATSCFYLLLSHHHLNRPRVIRNFIRSKRVKFIPMIHDIIPIEYPEYAAPQEPKRHQARMKTVLSLADGILVPTKDVKISIQNNFNLQNREIPIWPVQHGIHEYPKKLPTHKKNKKPYFVYLSTIEPRKNHLMLLHLWRKMISEYGRESTPHLLLIGKRGWENENILDMLERCPSIKGIVTEDNSSSDSEVRSLIQGSNGLLFPSFAEGYGLPLAEAMSLSTPCICSDILALKEVGQDIPLYLDPLDTLSWQMAINDFAQYGPLWQDQKEKLKKWKPYTWSQSIEFALSHLN